MSDCIVETSENVTLIGAGKVNKVILADALTVAPYLIAADGGAKLALKYGTVPKKVIGDMDSLDTNVVNRFPPKDVHILDDQDTTDFDKCLSSIRAPLILGVGFLGKRMDHQLAALNSIIVHAFQNCILLSKTDVIFHLSRPVELNLRPGSRLSLFPMRDVTGVSEGLHWPIEGLKFAPGVKIGTSNRVTEPEVRLDMAGPGMLVILPRADLGAVVKALTSK